MGTYVVMVLAAEVDGIHVHATVVRPVVRQGHNQLYAGLRGPVYHLIEGLDVDCGLAILPHLEVNLSLAGALAAVLGETLRVVGGVLVVETPGAEDAQAGILSRGEALLDVVTFLCGSPSSAHEEAYWQWREYSRC